MTLQTTSTAQWSLVIHRVTESTVEIWVGTLFPTLKMPESAKVELTDSKGNKVATKTINKQQWQRPFSKLKQRFYALVTFTGLPADKRFNVSFTRKVNALEDVIDNHWQTVKTGEFETLPKRIPLAGKKPFTIAIGSCFYNHRDGGSAAAAYNALYEHGNEKDKPSICFLTGDQVYLDIGFDSLSLKTDEIRQRIADDYALHWQSLGSILSKGATWMLPDDHEYWNDYPFYKTIIPQLAALRISRVRKAWDETAKDGVNNVQRSAQVEHFTIGNDLSVCLADFRSYRDDNGFISEPLFKKVSNWATSLTSPGVLVIPQPLIVGENPTEKNLRSYPDQYERLLAALASTGHDVVLLSGDVHFGRISSTELGSGGAKLIEVISSPLSNLTYLNGIATTKAEVKPKNFPDSKTAKANNWKAKPVNYYNKAYTVDSESGSWFSAYPKARTKEHFMTLGFTRNTTGTLDLTVKAWSVREPKGSKQLPSNAFYRDKKKQFKIKLT